MNRFQVSNSWRALLRSLAALTLAFFCTASFGAVIHVKWDSPSDGPGDSWDNACHRISSGLNAARAGDEVWVARGTYRELVAVPNGVALYGGFAGTEVSRSDRSAFPRPERDPNATVIDVQGAFGVAVGISYCSNPATRVDGFTITGAAGNVAAFDHAGGVYCGHSSATIANNTIENNHWVVSYGYGYAAGIRCAQSDVTLQRNLIRANSIAGFNAYGTAVAYGGGICCVGGTALITVNTVSENTASSGGAGPAAYGGGIYLENCAAEVSGNLITANSVFAAGGVALGGGVYQTSNAESVLITNNTIADNGAIPVCANGASGSIGGIYCNRYAALSNNIIAFNANGVCCPNSGNCPSLSHNNVYNPSGLDYCTGLSPDPGSISADPVFVNSYAGDYHLSATSPCVDAGDNAALGIPAFDIDGEPRIVNGTVDIGADEVRCAPPYFVTQPQGQAICGREAVTLVVAAARAESYQWRSGGSEIPGATDSSFVTGAPGSYDCVVSNACGTVTSDAAVLTADITPPIITVMPASGAYTLSPGGCLTVSFGAEDPGCGIVRLTAAMNGNPFISGDQICASGNYQLVVTAEDYAGNVAVAVRDYFLTQGVNLTYTLDLLARVGSAHVCAAAASAGAPVSGMPIEFKGTTLAGFTRTLGPAITGADGEACVSAAWPADVYEVAAKGAAGSPIQDTSSPPVAVTIFTPGWPGMVAGGEIVAGGLGAMRRATFGLTNVPGINGQKLLYLDPLNPTGAVKVTCTKFDRVVAGYKTWTFYGWCSYSIGAGVPVSRKFTAFVGYLSSGKIRFSINVMTNQSLTIYYAAGDVSNGGVRQGF